MAKGLELTCSVRLALGSRNTIDERRRVCVEIHNALYDAYVALVQYDTDRSLSRAATFSAGCQSIQHWAK